MYQSVSLYLIHNWSRRGCSPVWPPRDCSNHVNYWTTDTALAGAGWSKQRKIRLCGPTLAAIYRKVTCDPPKYILTTIPRRAPWTPRSTENSGKRDANAKDSQPKKAALTEMQPYTQPTVIYSIQYWVIAPSRGMAGLFLKKKYLFPALIQIRAIFEAPSRTLLPVLKT